MNADAESPIWRVPPEKAGQRLDRHIASRLEVPRHQVQRWIRDDRIRLQRGEHSPTVKPSTLLEAGDEVSCALPESVPDARIEAEAGELDLLYEDEHLLAVNKAAGLAVHPGAGRPTGTLVHRLVHHFPEVSKVGGKGRPGIVHRLDLDTTGLLLIARTELAYRRLNEAFGNRSIRKTYLAIAYGRPAEPTATIDRPIGRHPRDRKRMTVRRDGRPSVTHYAVKASSGKTASWLEIDLETGRTHQIRVHLKAVGHPLVGDPIYGEARWRGEPTRLQKHLAAFPRPALHAWRLALEHPVTEHSLELEAPVPADLLDLWRGLGGEPPPVPLGPV